MSKAPFKCPDCGHTTEYLDYFDEEHTKNKYIVHCRVKCPKCLYFYIIREEYIRDKIEVEW